MMIYTIALQTNHPLFPLKPPFTDQIGNSRSKVPNSNKPGKNLTIDQGDSPPGCDGMREDMDSSLGIFIEYCAKVK